MRLSGELALSDISIGVDSFLLWMRLGTVPACPGAAVQIGFANADQKLLECKTAIEAVGEKVSKLRRSGKAKGRYADEAKTLCWHYWTTANNREEVWRSVNTRITYKSVFEHGRKHLACVGVTSEKEFKKIIHAEAMRHNRELQTKQDEARESASKSNTKRGENGIMHSMKNRAKPALAIALARLGALESCAPFARRLRA